MPFTLKQFHIDDSGCGMPVSTDAIVLGAWANLSHSNTVLDIGTGSGVLALMAAQRSNASIVAVEYDQASCEVAKRNVAAGPWPERITVKHICIRDYVACSDKKFEHIICNPPYFLTGPQTTDESRANARHTNTLTFQHLIESMQSLLSQNGCASLILPCEVEVNFLQALSVSQLQVSKRVQVIPVRGKTARRLLLELNFAGGEVLEESLILRERDNTYTEEMVTLTKAFYLNL
ncbi:tRNA1(Val) (adenine(37)-N6)-methyltransferase [Parashewanella tropica]|uniref:tRNA1(Val) (adenine(37)-N6)-methyltransferase n=1 Tax=Parashewanella tropica TaxID=2547970 RepID=UPI00105A80D5|nr:methyltransferase [Parashewanella tropica]